MADTAKSLSDLQALFADNDSGNISPQDLRDFLVSSLGAYAEIRTDDGSTAKGSIGTTPLVLDTWSNDGENGESAGLTADKANDKITLDIEGKYEIHFQCSMIGTNGQQFDFEIYVDGAATGHKASIHAFGAFISNLSIVGIVDAAAGNDLDVRVVADSGSGHTITIYHAQLVAKLIG